MIALVLLFTSLVFLALAGFPGDGLRAFRFVDVGSLQVSFSYTLSNQGFFLTKRTGFF
jgi:hypothetical protein